VPLQDPQEAQFETAHPQQAFGVSAGDTSAFLTC
jgi:hypothetical protein